MELRVRGGRAVLAGRHGSAEQEVDPHSLPLGAGLADALHEWAKVADAVARAEPAVDGAAGSLVARRGQQLAGRVAAAMGRPVSYVDPLNGEVTVVEAPPRATRAQPTAEPEAEPEPRAEAPVPAAPAPEAPAEPTPWGTGLTVSAFTAAVVVFAVVTLSVGLGETSWLLALFANVMVVGGLAPSVWLARRVPVWRWVAYGVVAGVGLAWFGLILSTL
ncbi:DUF2537 domain-containing protein [Solihabitans fulvus]|uniref:DUF2537 domain-containing protein n=1 Tax=Solihabitans fulvus TaxID=1892852 RepID=A0A5B2XIA4_9PSEU|nr:DUF2537 domain-containing protein [Solihabitans fulvus]KAA2262966.1 DUF2537 domain-containing protein [Solihabitans fulvus]